MVLTVDQDNGDVNGHVCKSLGKFGKKAKDLVASFGVPSIHDFVQTYSNKSGRCHLCHGPLCHRPQTAQCGEKMHQPIQQ